MAAIAGEEVAAASECRVLEAQVRVLPSPEASR